MRKILASVLAVFVIVACFSMVTFAADDVIYFGDGSGALTASEDTVTVSVYFAPNDAMVATWVNTVNGTYALTDCTITATKVNGLAGLSDSSNKNQIMYNYDSALYQPTAGKSEEIAKITITRTGSVATSKVAFSDFVIGDYAGTPYSDYTTDELTITWPSSGEEVFEAKVEGTATEDVVALFAKNTTGAELAAGTYGIHFGGVDFAAGVDANKDAVACPKDGKFVVKFLYKDGSKIAKGTYEFWAYYDNGNEVSAKQTVEIK